MRSRSRMSRFTPVTSVAGAESTRRNCCKAHRPSASPLNAKYRVIDRSSGLVRAQVLLHVALSIAGEIREQLLLGQPKVLCRVLMAGPLLTTALADPVVHGLTRIVIERHAEEGIDQLHHAHRPCH